MTEQYPPGQPGQDPAGPVSGQPWSTHSGDSMPGRPGPKPPTYRSGSAQVPPPQAREYPPTSEFPAVDPAVFYQEHQPPPYQPPPYQPPAGRPPPPPPRRRRGGTVVAVVLVVALLLCGGIVTAGLLIGRGVRDAAKTATGTGPGTGTGDVKDPTTKATPTPTGTDDDSGIGKEVTVTYEVTGDGSAEVIYLEKRNGKTTHVHADLPWKVTLKLREPVVLNVTAARVSTDEGSITCRERVDGKVVKEDTSHTGHFNTVTCNYIALNE